MKRIILLMVFSFLMTATYSQELTDFSQKEIDFKAFERNVGINSMLNLGQESGGGNTLSALFATVGRRGIEIISMGDDSFSYEDVIRKIKNVKVSGTSEICYDIPNLDKRYCEDAHFYTDLNLILFDIKRWNKMSCTEKLVLSTHELMRAAGLETEGYEYSGRFLSWKFIHWRNHSNSNEDWYRESETLVIIENNIEDICDYVDLFERDIIANQ